MTRRETTALVETPDGPARATVTRPDGIPLGLRVLGPGAGGLRWTDDVTASRDAAADAGWAVALVDQPWRVAGRRIGGRPASLDRAWLAVLPTLNAHRPSGGPLVVGGRSAGARVACRAAAEVKADAVLALSFPLHPPGRPERSRGEELREPGRHGIPVHVIQGASDTFGTPEEVREILTGAAVHEVPGTHSLERSAALVARAVTSALSRC